MCTWACARHEVPPPTTARRDAGLSPDAGRLEGVPADLAERGAIAGGRLVPIVFSAPGGAFVLGHYAYDRELEDVCSMRDGRCRPGTSLAAWVAPVSQPETCDADERVVQLLDCGAPPRFVRWSGACGDRAEGCSTSWSVGERASPEQTCTARWNVDGEPLGCGCYESPAVETGYVNSHTMVQRWAYHSLGAQLPLDRMAPLTSTTVDIGDGMTSTITRGPEGSSFLGGPRYGGWGCNISNDDGDVRCLPGRQAEAVYADADCTTEAIRCWQDGCEEGLVWVSRARGPDDLYQPTERLALAYDIDYTGACSPVRPEAFEREDHGFFAVEPVPRETLPSFVIDDFGEGRLRARAYRTTTGARVGGTRLFHDTELDIDCEPVKVGEQWRCYPWQFNTGPLYEDATCSSPVVWRPVSEELRFLQILHDGCDSELSGVYELIEPVTLDEAFEVVDGACQRVDHRWYRGAPLFRAARWDPERFARLELSTPMR